MDKLINYGSDDECDDSPKYEQSESPERERNKLDKKPTTDTNYDDVGMDLSEDTDESGKESTSKSSKSRSSSKQQHSSSSTSASSWSRKKERDRDRDEDNNDRYSSGGHRRSDDKYKSSSSRRWRRSRSRSRDRHRSRSRSRSPSGRRSRRSTSKERSKHSYERRRYDKASNKMAHLEKMGIELKAAEPERKDEPKQPMAHNQPAAESFFLPGISGRLREQMERRKLLWQKKDANPIPINKSNGSSNMTISSNPSASSSSSSAAIGKSGRVWESTTFAQDQDGRQASKFKRLMGIKDNTSSGSTRNVPDMVKKQEELFSNMEQQYEVARTATHTMRGVGLGFGSYQR